LKDKLAEVTSTAAALQAALNVESTEHKALLTIVTSICNALKDKDN
jgi:hypothetical protein